MGNVAKSFALIMILIMVVSGLMVIEPAFAQISTPSVPEFTAKYVDRSYDIPPTYGVDPYTGKTVITKYGEHVDNRTIEITIINQPFTPFTDTNGNNINMFYNVRFKGSFGQDWTKMFGVDREVWYSFDNPVDNYGYMIQSNSSQYTIVEITNSPAQGQMDIQVEALEGYTNRTTIQGHIMMAVVGYIFYGQESGWSNTQTITTGENSPTPTPIIPEFHSWIVLILFMTATLPTSLVYFKKHKSKA